MTTKEQFFDEYAFKYSLTSSNDVLDELSDGEIESKLLEIKLKLNGIRGETGQYSPDDWRRHTEYMGPGFRLKKDILNMCSKNINDKEAFLKAPPMLTRAWFKFYEILCNFPILDVDKSTEVKALFLCEIPGAFINAANHFLKSHNPSINFEYMANALNPFYEEHGHCERVILDNRFLCNESVLVNWFFGSKNTGDILDKSFMDELMDRVLERFPHNSERVFDMITGDGAFDCSKCPELQEEMVFELIERECWIACNFLKDGGSMVIKFFTLFNPRTVELLYRLSKVFQSIHIFKPSTSKSGNCEVYIVFQGFNLGKFDEDFKQAFHSEVITFPKSFKLRILDYVTKISDRQYEYIKDNIQAFDEHSRRFFKDLNDLQTEFSRKWTQFCEIKLIKENLCTEFYVDFNLDLKEYERILRKIDNCSDDCEQEYFRFQLQKKLRREQIQLANPLYLNSFTIDRWKNDKIVPNIVIGKRFNKVLNTEFFSHTCLRLYNDLKDDFGTELSEDAQNLTQLLTKNEFLETIDTDKDSLFFDVYDFQNGFQDNDEEAVLMLKKTIEKWIIDGNLILADKDEGTNVILRFKSILSRAMIGLLFLFTRGFQSFSIYGCFSAESFKGNDFPDIYVHLRGFSGFGDRIRQLLAEPNSSECLESKESKHSGERLAVLEFVSVPNICSDLNFFQSIYEANSLMLFYYLAVKFQLFHTK